MADGTVKAAWIGAVALVLITLIGLWQYFDGRRANVTGIVANPMPGLTVELDSPANQQPVNEIDGFIRFNNVGRGPHALLFRHAVFDIHVRNFELSHSGVTRLRPDILLPTSRDMNQRKGATLYAFALQHSDDASEPVILQAAKPPNTDALNAYAYMIEERASTDSRRQGWVYLQKGNVMQAMADYGSTTTLKEPALLRTAPPTKEVFAEGYKLGKPSGFIDAGETVHVQSYVQVNDSVWAIVTPAASDKKREKKNQ